MVAFLRGQPLACDYLSGRSAALAHPDVLGGIGQQSQVAGAL